MHTGNSRHKYNSGHTGNFDSCIHTGTLETAGIQVQGHTGNSRHSSHTGNSRHTGNSGHTWNFGYDTGTLEIADTGSRAHCMGTVDTTGTLETADTGNSGNTGNFGHTLAHWNCRYRHKGTLGTVDTAATLGTASMHTGTLETADTGSRAHCMGTVDTAGTIISYRLFALAAQKIAILTHACRMTLAGLLFVFVDQGAGIRRATYLCLDCAKNVDKNWNIIIHYNIL